MVLARRLLPLLAVLLVAGCGGGRSVDGNPTDRAFAAAMVPHHEAAVAMADLADRRARTGFVRALAADVRRTQTTEIRTLRAQDAWLTRAGVERGDLGLDAHEAGMHMDLRGLETARDFDAAFLREMIPHHEGAIAMAKVEIAQGADPELKRLAERIVAGQGREIEAMRARL